MKKIYNEEEIINRESEKILKNRVPLIKLSVRFLFLCRLFVVGNDNM